MTKKKWIWSAGALLAGCLVAWIWLGRGSSETGMHHVVADADIPPAAVARVERHNLGSTLAIAGEFKAFQDVDVHAKVAGYIRKIYVDVGDRVKDGQTLAVLEVPELQAQLSGAEAAARAAQEQVRRAQPEFDLMTGEPAVQAALDVAFRAAPTDRPRRFRVCEEFWKVLATTISSERTLSSSFWQKPCGPASTPCARFPVSVAAQRLCRREPVRPSGGSLQPYSACPAVAAPI